MNKLTIRRWHTYLGLFIAPSVLFFSLTGAVQLFSLHEAHGDYTPAPLVEKLSSVHKDQVFAPGDHHGPPDGGPQPAGQPGQVPGTGPEGPGGPGEHDGGPPPGAFVLKGFFLLVALALSVSTAFGVWMGLTQTPRKALGWSLLVAGTIIPVLLLALG